MAGGGRCWGEIRANEKVNGEKGAGISGGDSELEHSTRRGVR